MGFLPSAANNMAIVMSVSAIAIRGDAMAAAVERSARRSSTNRMTQVHRFHGANHIDIIHQPRPEERAPELVEGCARLEGRPQARSCPRPSFETAARRARPPQDEVRGFGFDRSMRSVSWNRSARSFPALR